jgi:hypothetical protein
MLSIAQSFNLSSTLARLAGSSSSTMKSQQRTPDAFGRHANPLESSHGSV